MLTDLAMTRSRLYVLIDSFERNVRDILQKYVVDEIGVEKCLGDLYEDCLEKQEADSANSEARLVTYLDMRAGYDLLNRHRKELPLELASEIKDQTANFERVVPIRNRVMHARPLAPGDGDTAVSVMNQFRSRYWSDTHVVLRQLRTDPTWEPALDAVEDESSTLHNLPLPDYDDTGLIGRAKEVEEVVRVLKRGREPVVTITGEGGIGKTALAVEVAYRLVDDPDLPFDAVLWSSLKYEKLTAYGVRGITGSARDILGAVQPIGEMLDASFSGNLSDLSELLDGFNVLLVLDNLETVTGDEFRALYNALPDTVSYMITSRIGVGEYERRYLLEALTDKDALHLFSQFVKSRRISGLTSLTKETRIQVVKRLRFSPLAIKWFALAVEAGNDPLGLIKKQDDLLEFCVRSVYRDLSRSAQEVLDALAVLGRPLTPDEMVVLLESPMDAIATGVQELVRGSLVRRESVKGTDEILFQIALTDTATQFLSRRVKPDELLKRKLEERDREFRRTQERRVNDMNARSLAPVVVRQRTDADSPTCNILRQALLLAKKQSDKSAAYEKIDFARKMNPDFWEVDRVEGFIRDSSGDLNAARTCYERAYQNASLEDRAVVAHFYAGHLARKARDLSQALVYAQEAHDVLGTADTAVALGNYLIWSHQFAQGTSLIESVVPGLTGRTRIIAISALAAGWLRYSEFVGDGDRNYREQHELAWKGFKIADAAINAGVSDERLRITATDCAAAAVRGAVVCVRSSIRVPQLPERLNFLNEAVVRLVRSNSWNSLNAEVQKLCASRGAPAGARRLRQTMEEVGHVDRFEGAPQGYSQVLRGEVISLVENYGFIRHPDFPKNLFFHSDDVESGTAFEGLEVGSLVQFEAKVAERGPKAIRVHTS